MKLAILDDYQDAVRRLRGFQLLAGTDVKVFTNPARGIGQLAIRLASFDTLVLIEDRTRLSGALLRRLPRLKHIAQIGSDTSHIDVQTATECGINITTHGGDPQPVAELAWTLIMNASRRVMPYAAHLRDGIWQATHVQAEANGIGRRLRGRILGLWGYDDVAATLASYGRAFGMTVMVWGTPEDMAKARDNGHAVALSRKAFLESVDVLSLHLALRDDTRGLISEADLALMKPDALFVNVSHASLVADGALLAALREGRPGFAALDVFESEPLLPGSPLVGLPNVLATPHIGSVEVDYYEQAFTSAFEQILLNASNRNGMPD